jgi:exosortase A-associated hydrolase 2
MIAGTRELIEPVTLDGVDGPVFAIHHPPERTQRISRSVLYLPPFAEELNRSRRMAALQARSLAAVGIGTLVLDPYGCGDSGGDFRDARWQTWRDDTARAVLWMRQRGYETVALLGLRLGALLALDVAGGSAQRIDHVVLWQPVLRGEQMVTQFLRLRLAADLSGDTRTRDNTLEIRRSLATEKTVEIAGYDLHHDLVSAIDKLKLADLGIACKAPIDWIEVVSQPSQTPSPAHEQIIGRWRQAGIELKQHRAVGDPFWALQETTIAPAVLSLTSEILRHGG